MNTKNLLRDLALLGDILFILFIGYNAIDDGFRDIGTVRVLAPIGLVILLVLNIWLLAKKR